MVPPGQGKSRIIAASAVIAAHQFKLQAIYIVVPSEILFDTDKDCYESLKRLLKSVGIHLCLGTEDEALKQIT